MKKKEVYQEIEGVFGLVPMMFKALSDDTLENEWRVFKTVQIDKGAVPNKYRELIGLAISGVIKCKYCIFYHTELAKLHGATQEEIEEALHCAKLTSGWSSYISGLQLDFEKFKKEVRQACENVKKKRPQK